MHRSGKSKAPSAVLPGWLASAAQGCAATVSADRTSARTESTHPGRTAPHRSRHTTRPAINNEATQAQAPIAAGTRSSPSPKRGAHAPKWEIQIAERRPGGVGRVSGTRMCRDGECGQDVRSNRSDPPRQDGAPTASRLTHPPLRSKQRSRVAAGTDSSREPALLSPPTGRACIEVGNPRRRAPSCRGGRVSGTGMCRDGECGQDVRSNRSDPPRQGGAPTASRLTHPPNHRPTTHQHQPTTPPPMPS